MSLVKKLIWDLKKVTTVTSPNPYRLADDQDELGWSREKHGLFADQGTADDAIQTYKYGGEEDTLSDKTT